MTNINQELEEIEDLRSKRESCCNNLCTLSKYESDTSTKLELTLESDDYKDWIMIPEPLDLTLLDIIKKHLESELIRIDGEIGCICKKFVDYAYSDCDKKDTNTNTNTNTDTDTNTDNDTEPLMTKTEFIEKTKSVVTDSNSMMIWKYHNQKNLYDNYKNSLVLRTDYIDNGDMSIESIDFKMQLLMFRIFKNISLQEYLNLRMCNYVDLGLEKFDGEMYEFNIEVVIDLDKVYEDYLRIKSDA